MGKSNESKKFLRENLIDPGAVAWVRAGYVVVGYLLLFSAIVFTAAALFVVGMVFSFTFVGHAGYAYLLLITASFSTVALGMGSRKVAQWSVIGWCGVALALLIGVFVIPYGTALLGQLLVATVLAGAGVYYRQSFVKASTAGKAVGVAIVCGALIFVAAVARPQAFGGPSQAERIAALSTQLRPEALVRSTNGKAALMQVYGYSTSEIYADTVPDQQLLVRIQRGPKPFDKLVAAVEHSFYGYVDSLMLATFSHVTL
ncbi:MAG: hypothetical protein B7X04_03830 [Parcubacteria group bacterium 21-54-25]|nr:MAG: hypothetical protein B7X04_03830 [Parcubacteria group bacterium 21-54-25]HQU08194.1 hypothetical protein [Candidatus Paceibacterota bacterium]